MSEYDADKPRLSENDPDERARRSPVEYARKRVRIPAILMLLFAILSLAMVPLNVLSYFTLPETLKTEREYINRDPNLSDDQKRQTKNFLKMYEEISVVVVPVYTVFHLICGVVSVIGSLKMLRMRSHKWAMIASVVNIASIGHGCCFLTMPVGIWALIVLSDPAVRAAFAENARPRMSGEFPEG